MTSSFAETVALTYPAAVSLDRFAAGTRAALAPYGFMADNSLPLIAVCRDELMFAVQERLHREWGPPFDLTSLGAMVFLGRSGILAAAQHAPGRDGRRRFVFIVLPHIGIDRSGQVGRTLRPGQEGPSAACGALAQVRQELSAGPMPVELDDQDLELSLLRRELSARVGAGGSPDLATLTDLARSAAVDEIDRLSSALLDDGRTDLAVFSGVVIHGPDGDLVAPAAGWLRVGNGPQHIALAVA